LYYSRLTLELKHPGYNLNKKGHMFRVPFFVRN
jgi:hypothetical protein